MYNSRPFHPLPNQQGKLVYSLSSSKLNGYCVCHWCYCVCHWCYCVCVTGVTVCVTGVTIQEICILSTESIPVDFIELRRRGDILDTQHAQIDYFCNRDKMFTVR